MLYLLFKRLFERRYGGKPIRPESGAGSGTVESVSVTTANGVSGSVADPTTTPAITITLGAITPTTVNGLTITTTTGTLTMPNGVTLTGPATSGTAATLAGTETLTNKTIGAGTLTLAENASIALDPSLSADGKYSGTTIAGTAGATLAFGQLIYLAVADSRWELTDADSVTTAGAVLTGMCVLAAGADGDPTVVLLDGNIRADTAFPALTVGAPVYAGLTPGEIVVTKPSGTDDVVHVVGHALTDSSIIFRPSSDWATVI